jgi:hypothetical protein
MTSHSEPKYLFQRERVSDVFEEVLPLLKQHWEEIAHYKDIPLEPDFDLYCKIEEAGALRTYTARGPDGKIVGYCVYFVKPNLHYKSSLQAIQDVIFIDRSHRGFGKSFIEWCDKALCAEGVQVVYQHIKEKHNFGPMLERLGYELVDLIYARRL